MFVQAEYVQRGTHNTPAGDKTLLHILLYAKKRKWCSNFLKDKYPFRILIQFEAHKAHKCKIFCFENWVKQFKHPPDIITVYASELKCCNFTSLSPLLQANAYLQL